MAKTEYVRALRTVNLPYEGGMVMFEADAIVPASSPVLKGLSKAAMEEHFKPVVPGGGAEDGFGPWDVEQATAAPGEKRGETASAKRATPPAKK